MLPKNTRVRMAIPGGAGDGMITVCRMAEGLFLYVIDIHTVTIPENAEESLPMGRMVKINYCEHGRCELMTRGGEYTYLVGGEVAVDTGQTESHFYYPTADYSGIEVVVFMDDGLKTIPSLGDYADVLRDARLESVDAEPRPLIFPADDVIRQIAASLRIYDERNAGIDLMRLKGLELLAWIAQNLHASAGMPRRFYTLSQIEIARQCVELINEDLGRRWSAKALAGRFGISESSVKNYFRNVYGFGFLEYQNRIRMERAAELLTGSRMKAGEIARAVGYISQVRFGEAFRRYHGCLPLEYRRRRHMECKDAMRRKSGTGDGETDDSV